MQLRCAPFLRVSAERRLTVLGFKQATFDNIRITPIGPEHPEPTYCSGQGTCSNEMYSADPVDSNFLIGCPLESVSDFASQVCGGDARCYHCTQFNTLEQCQAHCTALGSACGGCTLECHTDDDSVDDRSSCAEEPSPGTPCGATGAAPGCWKYEVRAGRRFFASQYHERSWKKLSYTCLCDEAAHTASADSNWQDLYVFPDCSRSYQEPEHGCMDPAALNYNPHAQEHDHSCTCLPMPPLPNCFTDPSVLQSLCYEIENCPQVEWR